VSTAVPRPAVFLDRDGTVIEEREYLSDPAGVSLIAGTASAIRRLREAGYAIVIVTNQSGIARGLYTEADYHRVAARLQALLTAEGVSPDATYYCPHHPDHDETCTCRKPGTGMHRQAAASLELDLARSVYVGDKVSDLLPGLELGGRAILVRTGFGRVSELELPPGAEVADTLLAAVALILDGPLS
jgi:D,D-heptose 1,7-bisphosphate phosphatase